MSKRLTRAQRETIIIDFINGKETPGYEVKENSNGKFTVKAKPAKIKIEVEEEDVNEGVDDMEANGLAPPQKETPKQKSSRSDLDDMEEVEYESKPRVNRSKQNARELLKQLQQLLNEEDEADPQEEEQPPYQHGQFIGKRYNPGPQSWRRRKLVL